MTSLLPALIGYVVGEFVLISKELRDRKRRFDYWAYLTHGCIVAGFLFLCLLWQTHSVGRSLVAGLSIGVTHLLVEFVIYIIGAVLERSETRLNRWFGRMDRGFYLVTLFMLEQACHVATIGLITSWVWRKPDAFGNLPYYLGQLFTGSVILPLRNRALYYFLISLLGSFGAAELLRIALSHSFNPVNVKRTSESPFSSPETLPIIATSQVAAAADMTEKDYLDTVPIFEMILAIWAWLGNIIVSVQNQTISEPSNDELPLGTGRWIGITERLMMMMMIVLNAWQGIGFIVAAKSMARFQELNSREKGEYYIVGTLMSSIVGVAMGMLLAYVKFQ